MSDKHELSQEQIESRAFDKIFPRGEALFENGAISHTVRRGDEISARCRGSYPQPYRVWAALADSEIAAAGCSCEYDWGGDCKHIVALLLTYLRHPERFVEGEPLRDALMSREKEHLLDIIEEMIILHPELEEIIEDEASADSSNQPMELQTIRLEIKHALDFIGEWMDRAAENKIYELTRQGSRYARRGEYAHAIAIYCAILDECNASDYPTDDEGQYVEAINNTVDQLKEALSRFDFADDADLRKRVLDTLVDTVIWDIEFGGIEYGYDAEDLILNMAQAADIPGIREHVSLIANRERTTGRISNWKNEAYESFLMKLDRIDATDPEETLKRLQAKELPYLCASLLLDLKRYEEAIEVIRTKLQSAYALQRGLDLLVEHQQIQTAIQIAEAALENEYEKRIAAWLIDLYQQQDDESSELRLQSMRMRQEPHVDFYGSLSAVSKSLGLWQMLRPQVHSELKQGEDYLTLTLAYLHDEDWDMAWETLAKATTPQGRYPPAVHHRLDFTVAKASRRARPALAIPIYIKYARAEIARRTRKHYADAAALLAEVQGMYAQLNDSASWQKLIADLRQEFARLPALQDELNRAGL